MTFNRIIQKSAATIGIEVSRRFFYCNKNSGKRLYHYSDDHKSFYFQINLLHGLLVRAITKAKLFLVIAIEIKFFIRISPMKRIVLILLLLCGCYQTIVMNRGDGFLAKQHYTQAAQEYDKLLKRNPDAINDPRFSKNYQLARSRSCFQKAQQKIREKDWAAGIELLQKCLEIDKDYAEAKMLLKKTSQNAAVGLHKSAIELADRGELARAIREIERVLKFDSENPDAMASLASTQYDFKQRKDLYHRGYVKALGQRWLEAGEIFEQAIAENPNHLPARVDLREVILQLEKTDKHFQDAKLYFRQLNLKKAKTSISLALAISPHASDCLALQEKIKTEIYRFDDTLARAKMLLEKKEWDRALAQLTDAERLYPDNTQTKNLQSEFRKVAADWFCNAAEKDLQKHEFSTAEKSFKGAYKYIKNYSPATAGLAKIPFEKGQLCVEQKLWGHAWVWFHIARNTFDSRETSLKIQQAKAELLKQAKMTIHKSVQEKGNTESINAQKLSFALNAKAIQKSPSFVTINVISDEESPADYFVQTNLKALDVYKRVAAVEQRTHEYLVYRNVTNPDVDRLRVDADYARRNLRHLEDDYNRSCNRCSGRGYNTCNWCSGHYSNISCSHCRGSGYRACNYCRTGRSSRCNYGGRGRCVRCSYCSGRGHSYCGHCNRSGRLNCSYCNGSGRGSNVSSYDVRRAKQDLQRLKSDYRSAPRTIRQAFPAYWKYTLRKHEKIAKAVMEIKVYDGEKKEILHSDEYELRHIEKDDEIVNANPSVGLQQNTMWLPADSHMLIEVLDKAAEKSVDDALHTAVELKIISRLRNAQFSDKQDPVHALELRSQAVAMMKWLNPQKAEKYLKRLKADVTYYAAGSETVSSE